MVVSDERARIASLAHGLAHEVAALTTARAEIRQALEGRGDFRTLSADALRRLDDMIEARKGRVAMLGAEVAGHA